PFTAAHCPMAFDDKGASWLQRGDEILNPYFGSEMPSCGSVERSFEPRAAAAGGAEPGDEQAAHEHAAPAAAVAPALTPLYEAYLDGQEALAADDPDGAAAAAFRRLAGAVAGLELETMP